MKILVKKKLVSALKHFPRQAFLFPLAHCRKSIFFHFKISMTLLFTWFLSSNVICQSSFWLCVNQVAHGNRAFLTLDQALNIVAILLSFDTPAINCCPLISRVLCGGLTCIFGGLLGKPFGNSNTSRRF